MELLLIITLFFLRSRHVGGFSHCRQTGWKSFYILTEREDLDVTLNGYTTGLQAPCRIYIAPHLHHIQLELKHRGQTLCHKSFELVAKDSFVIEQVDHQLHLLA